MKRQHLYILYAGLWALTILLLYQVRFRGGGAFLTFILYGAPVLILYLISVLLLDVRESIIEMAHVKDFLWRRKISIGMFFFGMVILILLIFK